MRSIISLVTFSHSYLNVDVYAQQQQLPRGLFSTIPHVSALIHSGSVSANSSCAYINQSERARVVQICAGGISEIRAWQAQRAREASDSLAQTVGEPASQPEHP
jgi:hypothetical protein